MTVARHLTLTVIAAVLAVPLAAAAQDAPPTQDGPPNAQGSTNPRGLGRNGMGRGVRGAVTAVSGATVTIKTDSGLTWTVVTTDNTRVNIDRQPVKVADLRPGDEVMAMGIVDGDKHEVHALFLGGASAATVARLKADLGKTYIVGKVTAINDTHLTIDRPDHVSQTITLDETTSLKRGGRPPSELMGGGMMGFGSGRRPSAGSSAAPPANNETTGGMPAGAEGESITLADLKVGDNIAASGSVKGGSFVPTELHVMVRPQGRRGPRPDGNAPSEPQP